LLTNHCFLASWRELCVNSTITRVKLDLGACINGGLVLADMWRPQWHNRRNWNGSCCHFFAAVNMHYSAETRLSNLVVGKTQHIIAAPNKYREI